LVAGNFLAIVSDTIIKWQAGDVALCQFVLARALFTLALLLPFYRLFDLGQFWRGSRIHLLRAHVGLAGKLCMVVALTSLPLATANAIFYAAPVLVMLMGAVFFGERLNRLTVIAALSGFFGILLILRPQALSWGSLAALGLAVALAVNAVLVRKLPHQQSTAHSLFLTQIYLLPGAVLASLIEGASFDPSMLTAAFGSAFFILGYNVTVILAYRHIEAGRVTSSEYTGLLWAVLLGWWMFGEIPDLWFYLGAGMIVGPLIGIAWQGRRRMQKRLTNASLDPDAQWQADKPQR
jgi:drug/metabolite transporter (DMT)-like permease